MAGDIDILPIEAARLSPADVAALDTIFFVSSNTRTFASEADRARFRARWLGRFLDGNPNDLVFIARASPGGEIVGYCVGTLENAALSPRFADIGYFQDFVQQLSRFPAHLHINLAPAWRSRGIGQRLIETFATEATKRGAPGVHIVTSEGARNVGFYTRAGFTLQGTTEINGARLVFLGRPLHQP